MKRMQYTTLGIVLLTTGALFAEGTNDPTVDWSSAEGSATTTPMTGGGFALNGTAGQADAGVLAGGGFELSGGFATTPATGGDLLCPGGTVQECADLDGNGIRDDSCLFWACETNACVSTEIVFADMGGAFGNCPVDGTADGNDRFHALNCFANSNPSGTGSYPCEAAAPSAMNVDAGGAFGSCSPDGVCDGNDAFAALNAFAGISSCSCPLDGSPSPVGPSEPRTLDTVVVELAPSSDVVAPGALVEVDVTISGGVADLRGYQLHLTGSSGLELVDVFVEQRKDHAFAGAAYWDAYNLQTRQMLVGVDGPGIAARSDVYLATAVFRVTAKSGTVLVDLLHDHQDPDQRTFLFATPADGKVAISETRPAVIRVESAR